MASCKAAKMCAKASSALFIRSPGARRAWPPALPPRDERRQTRRLYILSVFMCSTVHTTSPRQCPSQMGGIFPIWEGSPPAARPGVSVGISGTQRTRPLSGPACPPSSPCPALWCWGSIRRRCPYTALAGCHRPLAFRRREPQGRRPPARDAGAAGGSGSVSRKTVVLRHSETRGWGGGQRRGNVCYLSVSEICVSFTQ